MSTIAIRAVAAIEEAKSTEATLSVDEALAQACSEAGDMTLGELKLAARAIAEAGYPELYTSSLPDQDHRNFLGVGSLLGLPGFDLDLPAAKAWLTLSSELGNPLGKKELDLLLMNGRLEVEVSR